MHVRHPIWLKRVGRPGAEAFAILFTLESMARAIMATILPLEALELLGSAQRVSVLFFAVSIVSIFSTFAVPWLVRKLARRWVYSGGALLLAISCLLIALDRFDSLALGMALRVVGIVTLTVCANLYIMDYIARYDFGRAEPMRVFYSAISWSAGPFLGVLLREQLGLWAPSALAAAFVFGMLGYFWFLRLSDSPTLRRPLLPVPSPPANLRRFLAQPRLLMAWFTSMSRNCWWVIFFVYVPIFAVESGLGELVGGLMVSAGTAFLFLLPIFARWARRVGIRRVLVVGFSGCGIATLLGASMTSLPWIAAAFILGGAFSLIIIDAVGNTPFMLAVHAHERPEMTTVYSTYRDVAEMAPPALFSLLLKVYPLSVVFVVGGCSMLAMAALARRIHPRLGIFRSAQAI